MKKVNRKAPSVPIPSREKPLAFFKEKPRVTKGKSPQAPMSKKRLSK
jgi:hypothetical protein